MCACVRAYVEKTNNFENNVHSCIPIANSHYNEKDNKLSECEHVSIMYIAFLQLIAIIMKRQGSIMIAIFSFSDRQLF